LALAAAGCALRRMYADLFALCRTLSPHWEAELRAQGGAPFNRIPWPTVLLALYAAQASLLACAARMLLTRRVTWAGVEYTRAAGRVRVVARRGGNRT
jgi:hypothetical protein